MEVQQIREQVADKALVFQDKVKNIFDRKAKPDDFQQGNLVLKWDARHEDKGKHGKFEHPWKGPYQISEDTTPTTCKKLMVTPSQLSLLMEGFQSII